MTKTSTAWAILVACLFAPAARTAAQDTVLGPHGGTTGTSFSTRAPAGERIRGIEARAGGFVEGIRLVYEDRNSTATSTSPWYGSTTGAVETFEAPPGDYVARIDVFSESGLVNRVRFVTNRGLPWTFGSARTGEVGLVFQLAQNEMVGLVGRSETILTALGVVVRPVLATNEVLGAGCAGTAGTPAIGMRGSGDGALRLGGSAVVEGRSMPVGLLAVLYYGASTTIWAGIPLPASLTAYGAPGCQVLVSFDFPIVTFVAAGGVAGHTLNVPNNLSLFGASVAFQWLVPDRGANALGFTVSPGLRSMIGLL